MHEYLKKYYNNNSVMKKLREFFVTSAVFLSSAPVFSVFAETTTVFGTIDAPAGVDKYNAAAPSGVGMLLFLSNGIRIATTVAGVWVMLNFILAGWKYITSSGDSKAHTEAASMMTNSVIGLAIIVGSYTLTAIVGLVFFGDATYILNPKFQGIGTPAAPAAPVPPGNTI